MDKENEIDEFSIWNVNSVLTHIKDNAISFILLICVFLIIYIADRLTNYNMSLMAAAAAMPLNTIQQVMPKKRKGNR
jgi:hypothetical protein